MITLPSQSKIFLLGIPVNMLTSFEGLCALVQEQFPGELFQAYYIFLNRRRDKMKVLYWDGDGFAIWYKRLEKGSFLRKQKQSTQLKRQDFLLLLEGITPKTVQKRFQRKPPLPS